MNGIPRELDWVKELAACSTVQVFNELRLGVDADVEAANLVRRQSPGTEFRLIHNNANDAFTVLHNGGPGPQVKFYLESNQIRIEDEASHQMFLATLTLNNEGRCKLRINDEELEQWQVRRMVLEKLFFGLF
jgi:hypothetical protein